MMKKKISILTLTSSLIVVLLCIVGILLSYFCIKDEIIKIILNTVLSTFASIAGVAFLWELIAKKSFANELYKMFKVSADLQASGVEYVHRYDIREEDWKSELNDTKGLTIFFAYGASFRTVHEKALKEKGSLLRVYLPNLEEDIIVQNLDYRFDYGNFSEKGKEKESVDKKIMSAICAFKDMGAKVYLHNRIQTHTFYIFDKTIILATYNHLKSRDGCITIKCYRKAPIGDFVEDELTSIRNDKCTKEVTDEELKRLKEKFYGINTD